jgi:hypothetical protein
MKNAAGQGLRSYLGLLTREIAPGPKIKKIIALLIAEEIVFVLL